MAPRGRQAAAAGARPRALRGAARRARAAVRVAGRRGAARRRRGDDPPRGGRAAADPDRREGPVGGRGRARTTRSTSATCSTAHFWPLRGRRFLLTDDTVAPLYADRIPDAACALAMPAGEEAKTLANAEALLRGLAAAGMDHDDHVVALGGGVVGDVAGFCAAVYQRGVGVVQVPTTLVAQVDSAYGGKTGVDLPEGKNYVGAYHQPRAVLADPRVLATLPAAELAAGWAEVIKTALIAGGPLWARVQARRRDRRPRPRAGLRAHQARRRGARRARRRPPAGAEPRPHRGPRDRDRDGLPALPPRRGRRTRAARGVDVVRPAGPARRGQRAAGRPAGCRPSSTPPSTTRPCSRPSSATRSAAAGASGFVLVEAPGDVRTGAPVAERDVRAALAGLLR